MICKECKKEIPDNATFCPNCGAMVGDIDDIEDTSILIDSDSDDFGDTTILTPNDDLEDTTVLTPPEDKKNINNDDNSPNGGIIKQYCPYCKQEFISHFSNTICPHCRKDIKLYTEETDNHKNKVKTHIDSAYNKTFLSLINIVCMVCIGFFAGALSVSLNANALYNPIVLIISGIVLAIPIIVLEILRYTKLKNEINDKKKYIFDLLVLFFSVNSFSVIHCFVGWIGDDIYNDFLLLIGNNRIFDAVMFAVFLIAAIIFAAIYKKSDKNAYLIVFKVLFVLSVCNLSSSVSSYIYVLFNEITYDELIVNILNIITALIGTAIFIAADTAYYEKRVFNS